MDRLSSLFSRFTPKAEVFFTGNLCEAVSSDGDGGHLHLLRSGTMELLLQDGRTIAVTEPAVVFLPQPTPHQILPGSRGIDLVCARVQLGQGSLDPLFRSIPAVQVIPAEKANTLAPALHLLFEEAAHRRCGHRAALDSLAGYFLVVLLRYLMESDQGKAGILGALADSRLAKALVAMHERPECNWTLEDLADEAGMSRARFAHHFRETVGVPPLEYLTDWRLALAQTLLEKRRPIKSIAGSVGYRSPAALTRAFTRRLGQAPTDWMAGSRSPTSATLIFCTHHKLVFRSIWWEKSRDAPHSGIHKVPISICTSPTNAAATFASASHPRCATTNSTRTAGAAR